MRKTSIALVVSLVMGIGVSACFASPSEMPERGAFLSCKVDSVQALVRLVSDKPSVAARYARHFGCSPSYIKDYFANNLKLVTVKNSRYVAEYFVGKNGKVALTKRLLPAGSLVFVTRDGKLVLDWRCGNPFAQKLPVVNKIPVKPLPKVQAKSEVPVQVANPTVKVAGNDPMELVQPPVEVAAAQSTPEMSVMSQESPVAQPTVEDVISPVTATPVISKDKSSKLPWLLPALLGLRKSHDDKPEPPQVPEPASMMVLAGGLTVAASTLKLKMRK